MTTQETSTTLSGFEHLGGGLSEILSAKAVVRVAEPMARRTTLRVGGTADLLVEPDSEADLSAVLQYCQEHQVPWLVLGRGSNLLVRDRGFRGAIISLGRQTFCGIRVSGTKIISGAGARLKAVAVLARHHSLAGVEFLEGIPGSVGGALRMNAGAMGSAIFDVLLQVRAMDSSGQVRNWSREELQASYRSCKALADRVALSADLGCTPGEQAEIQRRMKEYSERRWKSQPAAPSAGCMFKNPESIPAGK